MKLTKRVLQTNETLKNSCTEDYIERLSQPIRRKKNKFLQRVHKQVDKTNKAYCCDGGLWNPVKLNISTSTLQKLGA